MIGAIGGAGELAGGSGLFGMLGGGVESPLSSLMTLATNGFQQQPEPESDSPSDDA
jgi:hypothetical protein